MAAAATFQHSQEAESMLSQAKTATLGDEHRCAGSCEHDAEAPGQTVAASESSNGVESDRSDPRVKAKKKEDRSIEYVLKSLSVLSTPEERMATLCRKYSDLLEELRNGQATLRQTQKKCTSVTKERDQLQMDNGKLTLAKSKLESLCRELQRHNKLIKEESLTRAREEEEKRKEVASKFQITISDIQCQMSDNSSRNSKLRDENLELTGKLKHIIDQYELREQQVEKIVKHKELEQQLAEARLAQSQLLTEQEKDKSCKEKQILLEELILAKSKVEKLEESEKHLKTQLNIYTDKYTEFQSTLTKSNEVFSTFKMEMEKMTKKIKKLEKDAITYKTKWEESCQAVINLSAEKQQLQKQYGTLAKKTQQLENLCRALQAERKASTPPLLNDGYSMRHQPESASEHGCCSGGKCCDEDTAASMPDEDNCCAGDGCCGSKDAALSEESKVTQAPTDPTVAPQEPVAPSNNTEATNGASSL